MRGRARERPGAPGRVPAQHRAEAGPAAERPAKATLKRAHVTREEGRLKRAALAQLPEPPSDAGMESVEREVLIRSTNNTVVPKLVSEDLALYENLLAAVFPG